MKRSASIIYILALTQSLPSTAVEASTNKQKTPNFIVIFCDDLGFGDLSCFGHPTIKTPHLDRMASEGQKWTNFYVSASVSSPSRAGLMTGRLGVRTGMYGNRSRVLFPDSEKGLSDSGENTIASILQKEGYTTGLVGKWHLGHKPEDMPLKHGFDYFYGSPFSNDMSKKEQAKAGNKNYKWEYPIYENKKVVEVEPDQEYITKKFMNKAIEFIKENKDEPFFLYLSQPMPHIPIYASKEFQGTSARGAYGDTVEELDWSVGKIIETLKAQGLDENTLVVFTSDNGPWLSYRHGGGSAGHLKDGKASMFEGGFRVPCIMWGSMVKPEIITDMGSTLDLLPTFCDMAGITPPSDRKYDGVSLKNVITEAGSSDRKQFFYYRGSELYAMRQGKYKIHFAHKPGYGPGEKVVHEIPHLFDLNQDPEERYNISKRHPELIEELKKKAEEHLNDATPAEPLFDARNTAKNNSKNH